MIVCCQGVHLVYLEPSSESSQEDSKLGIIGAEKSLLQLLCRNMFIMSTA